MKKQTIIILGILLCLTLVSAGLTIPLLMDKWDKTLNLTSVQEDRIKLSSDVTEINVDVSPIQCNDAQCYAKISQEGVINTEWRRSKSYCFKDSECLEGENETCELGCLEYKDYTLEENQKAIQDYINKKLGDYANAEEVRNNVEWEAIDIGGTLKSTGSVVIKWIT